MVAAEHSRIPILRRAIKVILWILVGLLGVIVLAVVTLQFPGVQRAIVRMAVAQISDVTHTRIEVGSINVGFPHSVILRNIFVEDVQGDTLVSLQKLTVDVSLIALLSNKITLQNVRIDSLVAHVSRSLPDSSFNFDFILNALSDPQTGDAPTDTAEEAGWTVWLGGLELNGIQATYEDDVSGSHMRLRLGALVATIDTFDLDANRFHVDELSLENAEVSVVQSKTTPPDETTDGQVNVGFGAIVLSHLHLKYENTVEEERYFVDLGTSKIVANSIDLPSHHISLKQFLLKNTDIVVVRPQQKEREKELSTPSVLPWVVTLDQLILTDNYVKYDVQGSASANGLDLNHLRVDDLTLTGENIAYSDNLVAANIIHTSFRERSGIVVRELAGLCMLDSVHVQISDFHLVTPVSTIRANVLLKYSSMTSLTEDLRNTDVAVTVDDSHIAISDLLLLQPSLPIQDTLGMTIGLAAKLSGRVRDLSIESFRFTAGDSTVAKLTGLIRGLPEAETASYDVNLEVFSTTRNDIQSLVPDTLLPASIVLPDMIRINGTFQGTEQQFSAAANMKTSIGSVQGSVAVDSGQGPGTRNARWKFNLNVDEWDLGALLNDPEMFGPVTLTVSAVGTGRSKDEIEAKLEGNVVSAVVNGYPYRRVSLHGTARPNMFDGKIEIQDSNLVCTFNGTVNMSEEDPRFIFTFDVEGADLRRLNVTEEDIRVAGILTSDITGTNVNDMNGNIGIRQFVIMKNDRRYVIDSIVVASVNTEGKTHISIESPILAVQLDGTIKLGELPDALKSHLDRYFALQGMERELNYEAQMFTFRVSMRDPSILREVFFPDLHHLSVGTIEGSFDSERKNLNVNIDVLRVEYSDLRIDSLTVRVTSDEDALQASLNLGSIADSTLLVRHFQLSATAEQDSILLSMQSIHSDGSISMRFAGNFTNASDGYIWRFDSDGIVLHGVPWSVPADNRLSYGKGRLGAHHVVIAGAGQSLSLQNSDEGGENTPLRMEFNKFELATLSQIVERHRDLLSGTLNGHVMVLDQDQFAFTSDLTISEFRFHSMLIGDVALHASKQREHVFDVRMDISGNGNQIRAGGTYRNDKEGSAIDLTCDLVKVNLASVEPFAFGNVQRLSGTMSGELHLTGTPATPFITGTLNFANTAFNPVFVNTYLRLNDARIDFDKRGIAFTSFDLVDTLGNKASISGHVLTENFQSFQYDLRVHANRFLVMNKPASRDALFYGTVFLDCDISLTGDQKKPVVNMRAVLNKGTNLTLVLPESELAVEERKGIVRFVDIINPPTSILSRPIAGSNGDTTESMRTSIDLTSHITVMREAKLRIVIDPVAGDSLVIQGDATLSFTVDPSGRLTLTGQYEIVQGSYLLSFGGFIRKEFAIEKGSGLRWFGSPYNADVDITAAHTVKAAVLELVQDQLTGISEVERNKYKQEFPILVYIIMKGKLLSPDIHFKLDLPPEKRSALNGTVYAKLIEMNGQESELNKQVFALLVLGRFLPEQPLNVASGSGGVSGYARSSVSQMLSTQLNRLSERYIAGASLDVGVESYEDYSSGTPEGRTQLQLALSKQLFHDRVTVQVGGNVDVEGQRSQQNVLNNFAGDVKVSYKLTEDGRWQLQVFRQNSYEGAIDGDVLKTGAGIVFMVEYDKLLGITLKPISEKNEK